MLISDHGGDISTRRSTSGTVYRYVGGAISYHRQRYDMHTDKYPMRLLCATVSQLRSLQEDETHSNPTQFLCAVMDCYEANKHYTSSYRHLY